MDPLCSLGLLLTAGLVAAEPAARPEPAPEALVRELEKEIAARPAEAFAIARRGADRLASRPDLVKRLFRAAAQRRRERLTSLSKDEVSELADVYAKTLDDKAAADQVQRQWLRARDDALTPRDARSLVELARLALDWCRDSDWAARLCQEAYRLDQDPAAADFLRVRLGYRLTERGWLPPAQAAPRDAKERVGAVRRDLSASEVRDLLGPPRRISRQILYRRYLEQWTYDEPSFVLIEFDCLRGQEARVVNIHWPAKAKP
jgi:hypothetical protein